MKQTNITLDIAHSAVLASVAFVSLSADGDRLNFDRAFRACNTFLEKNKRPVLDRDVFDTIIQQLIGSKVINVADSTVSVPLMNISQRNPRVAAELVSRRKLPKNIKLVNKVLRKHNVIFEIYFNCDGLGSIKLPDGTITNANLQQLSDQLVKQHMLKDTEGKGGYMRWIVVDDNMQFDQWMNKHYPLQ